MVANSVCVIILLIENFDSFWTELASGWDFFGIPNRESWGFGIQIFYFELDRDIQEEILKPRKNPENPEIPVIEIGINYLDKIPKKSRVLNPENPKIPGIGIWIWKSRENPELSECYIM